jgi:hypothetical protein
MITRTSRGHFQVHDAGGDLIGKIDGDFAVGFEARTQAGRRLGLFTTVENAALALETSQAASRGSQLDETR